MAWTVLETENDTFVQVRFSVVLFRDFPAFLVMT